VHPPDRIKKKILKKEHCAGGQDFQFLLESTEWRCKSYSCHMCDRGNFLGWDDQIGLIIFRRAPLTTGWWDPAVCHEPCINVNNLGCDSLSTSEP
jgi:hypothetical protein